MTTDNIFGNDILSGDLNTSLVPELGTEDISLNITPAESSFSDPLNQELSLTEPEIVIDENKNAIDNSSSFNNSPSLNSISLSSIDPLTGEANKPQVNNIDLSDTSFAPPQSELELLGGFGDVDGKNDVALEIKDTEGNVVETFSLTGEGQASLYRDEEYQYIFFSDVDETTKVGISSTSNIKFGDYLGDSLKIETTGSIEGGDIVLNDEDIEVDSGLTLRAGIDTENSVSSVFDGYTLIDFGTNREMVDINNYGQIVGNDDFIGRDEFFFYDGQGLYYLPGYHSSRAFGINDYTQMVGEGLPTAEDTKYRPLIAYSNGSVQEIQYVEGEGRYNADPAADEVYTYEAYGSVRDINNYLELASYQLNVPPENAPAELELTPFEDAYFLSPDGTASVNIGYELLNSEDSRAFGINDLGQVVGINGETNRAFVFDRAGNFVTNLGTLPGGDYSAAYAINNQGQVVGTSTSSSGSRAFIYENGTMQDLGVSYTGDPESRVGIDINNLGQAVVTSAEGVPFVYQNGVVTNINNWLRPEVLDLGYTITEAKGINDRGQIIAQGTYDGSERGFLLNPTFGEVNQNIKVGNIATFGETVLLEGAEVYLEGKSIVTQGGDITFDGATKVNGNLTIDSSVIEDEVITGGGDITFTGTLDAASAGTGNLKLQAGTGNLLFKDTVGAEATFFDVAVESAGSVTINKDLAIDGNLSLEVIDDITTANLTAAGLVNISLGKVGNKIYPSTGNVTTGNINALGIEVFNNGNFTAGNLTTTDGDINVISLNQLNVAQVTANNGAIDLISGTAGITVNGTVQGDNGFIALAQQDIVTNEIISSQDAVILKSSQKAVTVNGSVTAFGDASLAAAGNVTVGAVTSNDEGVALISATGTVNFGGAISSMEDVTVASAQSLTIKQEIKAELGSIALGSTEGSVTVDVPLVTAIGVNIAAKQNVLTKRIRTYGGDVIIDAEQGTATIRGKVNSRGGDISISALGRVRTKDIISRSGDVFVVSDSNAVRTGYIRTDRGNRSGDVYLEAARNIKVAASFEVNGEQYSIYAGEDGVISVAHQRNKKAGKRGQFVIGDTTRSGTLALVTSPVTSPPVAPAGGGVPPNPVLIYIEIFRRVLDAGGTAPRHQSEINPITGQAYADEAEFELVEQLTPNQQRRFKDILNNQAIPEEERLRKEDVRRGTIDDDGCYYLVIGRQLGGYEEHDLYAFEITGDKTDHLVMTSKGSYSFYDGKLNIGGLAYSEENQALNSYAEVKTQHEYFEKAIDGDLSDMNRNQRKEYLKMKRQIEIGNRVANDCNLQFFLSFDNEKAANAIRTIFGNRYPKMNVYHIEGFGF